VITRRHPFRIDFWTAAGARPDPTVRKLPLVSASAALDDTGWDQFSEVLDAASERWRTGIYVTPLPSGSSAWPSCREKLSLKPGVRLNLDRHELPWPKAARRKFSSRCRRAARSQHSYAFTTTTVRPWTRRTFGVPHRGPLRGRPPASFERACSRPDRTRGFQCAPRLPEMLHGAGAGASCCPQFPVPG